MTKLYKIILVVACVLGLGAYGLQYIYSHKSTTFKCVQQIYDNFICLHIKYIYSHKTETFKDAQQIYNNLVKYTGESGSIPALVLSQGDEVNAYTSVDNITITKGLLKFVHSDDELAAVIGHEIGHFVLGDLFGGMKIGDPRMHEANADKYGVYLMLRAGYDPCKIKDFWVDNANVEGDDILTNTHPSHADRISEVDFPMCRSIF